MRRLIVFALVACVPPGDSGPVTASAADTATGFSTVDEPTTSEASTTTGTSGSPGTTDDVMSGTGDAPTSCPSGDVEVTTDEELAALDGCTEVNGDLFVRDHVTDLSPLAALQTVTGELHIRTTLVTSLTGLEGLHSVGALTLEGLKITSLAPLAGLTSVPGDVDLHDIDGLATLEGLHHLEEIGGSLYVEICRDLVDLKGLRALQHIGDSLHLYALKQLTGFHGLEALTSVGAPDGPPSVIELDTLPLVTSFDGLVFPWHNAHDIRLDYTGVTDLATFTGVTAVHQLLISDTPQVLSLAGLESLTSVTESFHLSDMEGLVDIEALAGLHSAGTVFFARDPGVTSLAPLASLTDVGRVFILQTALADVDLPGLVEVGDVHIDRNQLLTGLSGFSGLTTLGSLSLTENPALAGLSDLSDLVTVPGELTISDNDALLAVDELAALTAVGDLVIVFNGALPQVDAVAFGDTIAVDGTRKIAANLGYGPPADPCPWENDGICDAFDYGQGGAICAEGTDDLDCSGGD
ncbi:MAG: hypothetical protein R3B09_23910 [Nannocystaceae bacterium]